MDMNNELIDERAASPVGQPFRVCASKTEAEALELTKTNPNILYFSSDTNTIIFNGAMRTNPTPDLRSVLKKTDIIDNTSTNDNTKVLSAKQGKLLNDTKLNKTDVIGNLTNSDNTKALAASQGKVLDDKKIDKTAIENTVNSSDVNRVLSASMGKYLNDNKIAKSEIVDDTETDDATKPLSARQGKFLSDEITNVENSVQDIYTEIPTKTSELTNDSNYVTTNNVLTKTNTTEYSPTDDYHPATKNYVDNIGYGKVIDVVDGSLLTINKNIWGTEAYDHVVKIFGSTDVIKNIIIDICNNHTKYYIHSYSNYRNCIEPSSVYAYYTDEERYEIVFNINYYTSQGHVSKRIAIALNLFNDDKSDDRLFIEDILASDNLQRVVKRTASQYESTTPKDASILYAITE